MGMRIVFYSLRAHGLFDPNDTTVFGGAEVQLYHLSVGLAAGGHDVSFITRGPGSAETSVIQGVKVHKIPVRSGWLGKGLLAWDVAKCLRACCPQVCVQRCAGVETAMIAALARSAGARFCFMTASLLDCRNQLAQEGHPWVYQLYLWGLRRANLVICQNEEQQRLLSENFGIEAPVLRSACAPVEDDRPSAQSDKSRYVLWVGRCDPYKDPISFIQLARALPQISFEMVMPPGDYPDYAQQIDRELMGAYNLQVRRQLPFHEMDWVFRRASVLVNTSTLEGFPNTFLEAMRVGVPLLSYRLDPGGFLEREGTGVCAQGDFQALVNLCREWHESSGQAQHYGETGREYVRRTHDARIVVTEFECLLNSV
ncbi:MAG: glycosyltransferase family 4 protein [bacterium]